MKEELFNVAVRENGATDYTGKYRVLKVIPGICFAECYLLVVAPDRKPRLVFYADCLFLGF